MNDNKDLKNRILQMRQENSLEVSNDSKLETKGNQDNKESKISEKNLSRVNKTNGNLISKDQEAYRILATKFNDAVEVILELTTRVEKLETLVRLQSMQSDSVKSNKTENLKAKKSKNKLFFITMLLLGGVYLVYFFKIDLKIMHEIISEFSNIIKK